MNTVNVSLALCVSVSVSHPAICSCLGIEVCIYFIHGPKSLFALLPYELQWIVWKCRKKATWQNTKSTKAPLPLLFRAQLVPSFNPLLVCLIFPKPPFRWLLKIWRGPIVLQNTSREMSVCSKESKKPSQVSFIRRIWEGYSLWSVGQANESSKKCLVRQWVQHSLTMAQKHVFCQGATEQKRDQWSICNFLSLNYLVSLLSFLLYYSFLSLS